MPPFNFQLSLPENVIENLIPSNNSVFTVNYSQNIITKPHRISTHVIVGENKVDCDVFKFSHIAVYRKKEWRKNPVNRRKDNAKRKGRIAVRPGNETPVQPAEHLKR